MKAKLPMSISTVSFPNSTRTSSNKFNYFSHLLVRGRYKSEKASFHSNESSEY